MLQAFLSQIDWWAIYTVIALILGYVVIGLVLSIKDGKSELITIGKWILEEFLPMCGGYIFTVFIAALPSLALAPKYVEWFKTLPLTIFAFITAMLIGKIKAALQEIFPWIPDIPVIEAGRIKARKAAKAAAIAAKAKPAAARSPT